MKLKSQNLEFTHTDEAISAHYHDDPKQISGVNQKTKNVNPENGYQSDLKSAQILTNNHEINL